MVFTFVCSCPEYAVFMGRDKFENDELLNHSFPEDIWFHVDKFSSAHIYLRLPLGSIDLAGVKDKAEAKRRMTAALDSIPQQVMNEMCQITRQNSIDGCKQPAVDIVYTPYLNLKKEERMDVGQVGFKDESFRLLVRNVEKDKEMIKTLEKTRQEEKVDFAAAKAARDEEERANRRRANEANKQRQKEEERKFAEEKELKSYSALQGLEMKSNADVSKTGSMEECREIEEDFM